MTDRPSAREIDDEAAAWALRIDPADSDGQIDAELEAWLAADPRRCGALLRAQAALSLLDRTRALSGGRLPAAARRHAAPTRRVLLIGGGAGGALAAGLGAWMVLGSSGRPYKTGLGEIRRVPLEDGTMAVINTQSALEVDMRPKARNIRLRQGEAWFDVAKDATRPFLLAAGGARVQAVGTAFSVRRQPRGAEVMVTEGVVEAWLAGEEKRRLRVGAGFLVTLGHGLPAAVVQAPKAIERSLAWIDGQISLDGESLGEAAAEFNRYNAKPILIDDPALARTRFVGLFQTGDPHGFAAAVAASTGARMVVDDQGFHLTGVRQ